MKGWTLRLASVAVLALVGCSDEPNTAQVLVQVHAEGSFETANGRLEIQVFGGPTDDALAPVGSPVVVDPTRSGDFPYVVALAPRGGDLTRRWRVRATLTSAAFEPVAASVSGGWHSNRIVQADLFLRRACVGTTCSVDETCGTDGTCGADFVDVTTLPTYTAPRTVDGGVRDAGGSDGGPDADGGPDPDTGVPEDGGPDAADAMVGCGEACAAGGCGEGILDCSGARPICTSVVRAVGDECGPGGMCTTTGACRVLVLPQPRPDAFRLSLIHN